MAESRNRNGSLVRRAALLGGLCLATLAGPASAYVVVTSDNRVFDVPSKPTANGDLIIFTMDGNPVSLRIYDVNLTKTNEINHLYDTGASPSTIQAQVRALRTAVPTDDRIIISSRLERMLDQEYGEDAGIARREMVGETPQSMDNDRPGARRAAEPRPFEREARAAMSEAEQRMHDESAPASDEGRPRRTARTTARSSEKVADIDAEIAAEQEYLRKLTSGELTVGDLEGEIDRSMDKIKRLQKRRDAAAAAGESTESAPAPSTSGKYPAGSREAKWEAEMQDAQAELARLQSQQAASSGSAREREGIDERVGELQWKIERLRKKLGQ